MKTLIVLFALSMLALGSCTETIYEEVIKHDSIPYAVPVLVPGPTIFLADTTKTPEKECESTDTLKVEIVLPGINQNGTFHKDTLLHLNLACNALIKIHGFALIPRVETVRDSIIYKDKIIYQDRIVYKDRIVYVDREVIVHDTVREVRYDRTVVYYDTFTVVSYMRPTYSVPDNIQPFIEEFYGLCHQYNRQTQGSGMIIVQFVSNLPGENWPSTSFEVSDNSQQVIQLDERYPAELHRASIFRELSRLQLGEKYTNTPDRIMNPTFSPETEIKQYHLNDLFE